MEMKAYSSVNSRIFLLFLIHDRKCWKSFQRINKTRVYTMCSAFLFLTLRPFQHLHIMIIKFQLFNGFFDIVKRKVSSVHVSDSINFLKRLGRFLTKLCTHRHRYTVAWKSNHLGQKHAIQTDFNHF